MEQSDFFTFSSVFEPFPTHPAFGRVRFATRHHGRRRDGERAGASQRLPDAEDDEQREEQLDPEGGFVEEQGLAGHLFV